MQRGVKTEREKERDGKQNKIYNEMRYSKLHKHIAKTIIRTVFLFSRKKKSFIRKCIYQ